MNGTKKKPTDPGAPRYKRRTYSEALQLARAKFHAEVAEHWSVEEMAEFRARAITGGGPVPEPDSWLELAGFAPDDRYFYEVFFCEPSLVCGGQSPKVWARILISRDRSSELCIIDWHPGKEGLDGA